MAFLEIDHLYKDYGPVEVLKDIDLSIEEGGFLVLVGPSGCGKSTLLYTIAGLEAITRGEIRIDGRTVNDLPPSKRDIAMVFQSYALYPSMSVAENIGFGMEMRGVPKAERQRAIAEVAKTLQIEHLLARRPAQLSGGQRQRVAMGRGAGAKPQALPVRRAPLQPRRQAPHRDAHRDQASAPVAGDDHRLRDPRPDRGDDPGDADRGAEGRRPPAVRHPGRYLRRPRQPVRGGLHGLAADEPDSGDGAGGRRGAEPRRRARDGPAGDGAGGSGHGSRSPCRR